MCLEAKQELVGTRLVRELAVRTYGSTDSELTHNVNEEKFVPHDRHRQLQALKVGERHSSFHQYIRL